MRINRLGSLHLVLLFWKRQDKGIFRNGVWQVRPSSVDLATTSSGYASVEMMPK